MRLPMSLDHALASLRNRVQGGDGPAAIRKRKAGPAKLLLVGYLSYVVIGWILLSLPFSQAQPVSALDNLFTAVSAVSTTGLISAALQIGLGDLLDTGYGRVLLAKAVGLVILIGLGVYARRRWVPGVDRHQLSEATSLRLATVELVVMGVVLGRAVGLAGTAP